MRPTIAFDQLGAGPPVIIVLGAFNTRSTGAPLATALAAHHTVINYDRRGRGGSGDSAPYAVEREIEDLDGLVQRAGGSAAVVGFSSGAALALAAAAHGLAITRLALFDLPLTVARAAAPPAPPHAAALDELIRAGRRGDAVEYFQHRMVGIPEPVVVQMRAAPFRPALEAMAHTLVYEATILGDGSLPLDRVRAVRAPILALAAGNGPPFMRETAEAVARAARDGRALVLPGATHDLVPEVLGPPLLAFFR
jgi:hypothetical protein